MKMSQIDTKNDKNPKVFQILKILSIFSKLSTDIVIWNVKTCQQGKNVFSSMPLEEKNAVFQTNTVRK